MDENTEESGQLVFISYSRSDRDRVRGLALLLEALGNSVFLDQRTIKPGMRWEDKLQEGLAGADVLLVFWTRRAAQSDWVRKEYEYFATRHPDRQLVPVIGDEAHCRRSSRNTRGATSRPSSTSSWPSSGGSKVTAPATSRSGGLVDVVADRAKEPKPAITVPEPEVDAETGEAGATTQLSLVLRP